MSQEKLQTTLMSFNGEPTSHLKNSRVGEVGSSKLKKKEIGLLHTNTEKDLLQSLGHLANGKKLQH